MKNFNLSIKCLTLIVALFLGVGSAWATDYCQTSMTVGGKTMQFTAEATGVPNEYQIIIQTEEAIVGMNNFYCSLSSGNVALNEPGNFTLSADQKTYTCIVSSTTFPTIYTPLYVNFVTGGEINFGYVNDASWAVCSATDPDGTDPVMVSAMLVGSPGSNSATIAVTATDVDDMNNPTTVTKFMVSINGAAAVEKTATGGQITLSGLTPSTAYTIEIWAEDNAGNRSDNSEIVSFTTATPVIPAAVCSGDRGHFGGTPKIHYSIAYTGGDIIFTIRPIDSSKLLDVAVLHSTVTTGDINMAIQSEGSSATYTLSGQSIGTAIYLRFMYSFTDMPGNEMTSEAYVSTDPNVISYTVGDCVAVSEYCDYVFDPPAGNDAVATSEDAAKFTWVTQPNGTVQISIAPNDPAYPDVAFRNSGINAVANVTVNGAGNQFTLAINTAKTVITLTPIQPIAVGSVIAYTGTLEYQTMRSDDVRLGGVGGNLSNLWPAAPFTSYTYGYDCSGLVTIAPYSVTMVSASLNTRFSTSTTINVAGKYGADIAATSFWVVKKIGATVVDSQDYDATSGVITVTGLNTLTDYTLEIYAIDDNDVQSDNFVTVEFQTLGEPAGLYLAGTMNGWDPASPAHQFLTTPVAGVYRLDVALTGHHVYKLTTGSFTAGNATLDDHHINVAGNGNVTFYAKNKDIFACTADTLYLVGSVTTGIFDASSWATPFTNPLVNNGTQAVWEGTVYTETYNSSNNDEGYRLVKRYNNNQTSTTEPLNNYTFWDDLMTSNWYYTGAPGQARLTFDFPTLSWAWSMIEGGVCHHDGSVGEGRDGWCSARTFTHTYDYTISTAADGTTVNVEFNTSDNTIGIVGNLILFVDNYATGNDKLMVNDGNNHFTYTFTDQTPGTVISLSLKLAYPANPTSAVEITDLISYKVGVGCVAQPFIIYHHGQMPATGDGYFVDQFTGGDINRSIEYRRRFTPDVWETLYLPFTVTEVTVRDDEGVFPLTARVSNGTGGGTGGDYYLKEFTNNAGIEVAQFQNHWSYGLNTIPQKGIPYIFRFPNNAYWTNKIITFHGDGNERIEGTFTSGAVPTPTNTFNYYGNNTMMPKSNFKAYYLESDGIYFSVQTQVLFPFECYVSADTETMVRYPIIVENGTITSTTPTMGEEVLTSWSQSNTLFIHAAQAQTVSIYSANGMRVAQSTLGVDATWTIDLPRGIYLLQSDKSATTQKIVL